MSYAESCLCCWKDRFGDEERTVMHLVPAAAVRLMKRRVLSRPGVRPLLYHGTPVSKSQMNTKPKEEKNRPWETKSYVSTAAQRTIG